MSTSIEIETGQEFQAILARVEEGTTTLHDADRLRAIFAQTIQHVVDETLSLLTDPGKAEQVLAWALGVRERKGE